MNARQIRIRPVGQPGDLGWMVLAHGEIYAAEYGWDASFEAPVARIVADFAAGGDPRRQAGWIAEADGEQEPHRSYGADLIGQVYELDLRSPRNVTVS